MTRSILINISMPVVFPARTCNTGEWSFLAGIPSLDQEFSFITLTLSWGDFPGGLVVKTLPWNAGDMGSIPGQWESPHAPS